MTEKIAAISDKARTEPRDVYDLWRIACAIDIDHQILAAYVVEKIKFKGDEPAARAGNLAAKEKRLEKRGGLVSRTK